MEAEKSDDGRVGPRGRLNRKRKGEPKLGNDHEA